MTAGFLLKEFLALPDLLSYISEPTIEQFASLPSGFVKPVCMRHEHSTLGFHPVSSSKNSVNLLHDLFNFFLGD